MYTEYPVIYLTKHRIKPGEKSTRFTVIMPCRFEHLGQFYEIPKDFKSDFSSVPRSIWSIIPPHGLATNPSIKHDYLYDNRIGQKEIGSFRARLAADQAFYQDLLAEGMHKDQAKLMYDAVRRFGETYWID